MNSSALPVGAGSADPFFLGQSRELPAFGQVLSLPLRRGSLGSPLALQTTSLRGSPGGLVPGDRSGDPLLLKLIHGKPLCGSKTLFWFLGSSGGLLEVALTAPMVIIGVTCWHGVMLSLRKETNLGALFHFFRKTAALVQRVPVTTTGCPPGVCQS